MVKVGLKVDWGRWEKYSRKFEQFDPHMEVMAKELTNIALYNLKRLTPRKVWDPLDPHRSQGGRALADAWTYQMKGSNPIYIQIFNSLKKKWDILRYLEFGTKPHLIPRSPLPPRRWLYFLWRGDLVFAKQTHHQGSRAFHMVSITRTDLINRLEYLKRELPKILAKNLGGAA